MKLTLTQIIVNTQCKVYSIGEIEMRVYVSHSIRGPKGKDATKADMEYNCNRIKLIVGRLRKEFPDIDFYVPAEHENFVYKAYNSGYITEEQILNVDCAILNKCDILIIFTPFDDNKIQGGRLIEKEFAIGKGITVITFPTLERIIYYLKLHLGLEG